MRLPHPGDPQGAKEGSVRRKDVLEVLFRHRVTITHLGEDQTELIKDDLVEVQSLPLIVGGLMVRYLSRKFEIPIEDFYFPKELSVH